MRYKLGMLALKVLFAINKINALIIVKVMGWMRTWQ